ncbi:MAG: sodium:proton antiporter [Candidatus Sericytochromatia bacterium]|nr:sodium:proton antiporter [Candidatus Sericytochromatia bacterium]
MDLHPQPGGGFPKFLKKPAFWFFILTMMLSVYIGQNISPTWTADRITLEAQVDEQGAYYMLRNKRRDIENPVPYAEATLHPEQLKQLNASGQPPEVMEQYAVHTTATGETLYYQLLAKKHWGPWSLLPALVAIGLCFLNREPVTALLGGVVSGGLILGHFDILDKVLLPNLATTTAAGMLILYLWLLGGLMGIWSRMGAPRAFAELMTKHVVKGPRSAKLVGWILGVVFFQGGTVSTVLVGTTVKPLCDKENVSHEELAYIVDSTASPIASLIAFNAWPGYVQAFLFVAGVPFLATEADRIAFFFKSIPFSFYAIFAVLSTFLLSIDKLPWMSKNMRTAIDRSRNQGLLDAPYAKPLAASDLENDNIAPGYTPSVWDFFAPLILLIGLAIATFLIFGSPKVRWAFGAGLLLAAGMALFKGMSLLDLIDGFGDGMKGVVMGSVILLLAITIGAISQETGGGNYLVELLGESLPYWALPTFLALLTMIMAFSTGSSFGTYAVAFPLAMPLAWAIAESQGLGNPMLYMMVAFASVLNGSVFGDQCSPISDTTVLSAMCTGCDLMDHVKTQLPNAAVAAVLAIIGWTLTVVLFAA